MIILTLASIGVIIYSQQKSSKSSITFSVSEDFGLQVVAQVSNFEGELKIEYLRNDKSGEKIQKKFSIDTDTSVNLYRLNPKTEYLFSAYKGEKLISS